MKFAKKSYTMNILRLLFLILLAVGIHFVFSYFRKSTESIIKETSAQVIGTVSDYYLEALEETECQEEIYKDFQNLINSSVEGKIYEAVDSMRMEIIQKVYLLSFSILIYFVIVLVMFFRIQRKSMAVEQDVENYELTNEQNSSCMFDYNLRTGKIKFTGSYKSVFGNIQNPINVKEFRKLYANIHEEDRSALSDMGERLRDSSYSAEVRFRCLDGEFRWFKISGVTKKDQENKPERFIGSFTDVHEQMMHEDELKKIAETDLLSGLLNKSFYQKKVSDFLISAPEGSRGAFFIIDLDNFKTTNDTLGHAMGDIAIRDTAQKITLIFSQKDFMGRIGGDEFCVYLRMDDVSEIMAAKIIMEKAATLNESLQEYFNNEKDSVQISASVGIALYPQHGKDFASLFRCADAALYYVKKNGKNGNVIYTEKMKNGDERFYE